MLYKVLETVASSQGALIGIIGVIISFTYAYFFQRMVKRMRERIRPKDALTERIQSAIQMLSATKENLAHLQDDLEKENERAEKLKQDVEKNIELKEITSKQIEALTLALEKIETKNSRKSLWQNALVAFVFFVAGIIVTLIIK